MLQFGPTKHRLHKWLSVLALCALLALTFGLPAAVGADDPPWPPFPICQEGELGDQLILICRPGLPPGDPLDGWNGQLVVYAHGYVAPDPDPEHPNLALPAGELGQVTLDDGTTAVELFLSQGYAFATTSYSKNGYAVRAAEKDLNELVRHFKTKVLPNAGMLEKVILVGASEGGLITTLMVEKYPGIYDGGMALCGPISGMPRQAEYLADFRVVFDVFFPQVFRTPPIGMPSFGVADVPANAYQYWDIYQSPAGVPFALQSDPVATGQLLSVTGLPFDPLDPFTIGESTLQVLYYSVWGTPDMIATAGGMPYDNEDTLYTGSLNDAALNAAVERIDGDGRAHAFVRRAYEPTGDLEVPLVTLHNPLDPGVPYWHELEYGARAAMSGMYVTYPGVYDTQYGHCVFSEPELLWALGTLQAAVGP